MHCFAYLRMSYSDDKVIPTLDTLLITSTRERAKASVVQAALRVWYTLSRCDGYSFRQNVALWCTALNLDMENVSDANVAPVVLQHFPRVVMFWDTNGESLAIDSLRTTFLDVFDPSQELPAQAEGDIAKLSPFITRPDHDVACFVRVRFTSYFVETEETFRRLSTRLVELNSCRNQELVLRGIEVVGPQWVVDHARNVIVDEMNVMHMLCDELPSHLAIDMRYAQQFRLYIKSPQDAADSQAFRSFLVRFAGLEGSEFHGRTRILDLINGLRGESIGLNKSERQAGTWINFASLCSLLP